MFLAQAIGMPIMMECYVLLSIFIPWPLKPVSQIDAIGKHGESSGLEDEFLPIPIDVSGPGEGAFFKSLGHHPVAGTVKIEDLDEPAALVGEEEGGATEWIELEVIADKRGERVEAFAHVAWFEGDIDFEISVEAEHGVGFRQDCGGVRR